VKKEIRKIGNATKMGTPWRKLKELCIFFFVSFYTFLWLPALPPSYSSSSVLLG
jgi:hypothetical protein